MVKHLMNKIIRKVIYKTADVIESYIPTKSFEMYKSIYETIAQDKVILQIGATAPIKQIIRAFRNSNRSPAEIYCEIANFLLNCGQPEQAQLYYQMSLKLASIPSTYSLYLQCLLLSPTCTEQYMKEKARLYYDLFLSSIQPYKTYCTTLSPNKKLNIGYLCHFFHNSVSQSTLIPVLKNHDRQRVKIFCYSDADVKEVPEQIMQVADVWRNTKEMTDSDLAELVRQDQIDILLELNGHCIINRYGVMAKKPAPILASYYNYCATTGIPTIDYNIIGGEVNLDESKQHYSESIYFLKGVGGSAKFANDFPECAPPPYLKNRFITFGSFGAAHKVNYDVISLWCDVLKRVPNSKFYMKASVLTHRNYLSIYKKLFADNGIYSDRLHLEGFSDHREMLRRYGQVDIALDTYPHAAGTTTMEALWQGVPVITLAGKSYVKQNGKAILTSINHSELIATSREEYITKAAELAGDPDRLIAYRKNLRRDFRKSPRGNPAGLAKKFDDAYHDMWARYCAKNNIA